VGERPSHIGSVPRRTFLGQLALAAGATAVGCREDGAFEDTGPAAVREPNDSNRWSTLRQQFPLSSDHVHMSALLIASHPAPVGEAIARYRDELDRDPVQTLRAHNRSRQRAVQDAAAAYLGADGDDIVLTDSTTMGVGLMYNGLRLRPGDEILTTTKDYYVTHEAARQAANRYGGEVRQIDLYDYDAIAGVSQEQLVDAVARSIGDRTRVVALTWVHSSTGLKLPLGPLGDAIGEVNRSRDDQDQVLLAIDGVHGFGVEDIDLGRLRLDFFAAGCHKWLFGPRGTGILWGRRSAWRQTRPLIPSFTDDGVFEAWLSGNEPEGPPTASLMTPGGFKAFEHQWAMTEAFALHQKLGKADVQRRTHELATQLKEGLRGMSHVRLVTPLAAELSSGIVCFDVARMSPSNAVKRLGEARIVASVTPYAVQHVRLSPSVRNTTEEIDRVLDAVRKLA
jgi:isopenicillin-N epimerase